MKMRVLLTCRGVLPWTEDLSGGQELYVLKLAEHLAMAGHQVHVIANCPEATRDRLAREGIVVHQSRPPLLGNRAATAGFYGWLWAHFWGNLMVSRAAVEVLRKEQIDVVHCHGAFSLLLIARWFSGVPIVYTCHDSGPWLGHYPSVERAIRKAVFSIIDLQAINAADQLIVNFDRMREHLIERWGTRQNKITVISNGVDTDSFTPALDSVERHGVLFVGHLTRRKGVDLLIPLAQRNPELEFTVIGDGPERKSLERQVVRLGMTGRLKCLGAKANSDIRDYLVQCRTLLMPSRSDTMPQVMLESLSCAIPVVAFNAGGTGEVIRDGWNGFLAEIGDLDTLERGLRLLCLDGPELSMRLGQNGRDLVQRCYGWSRVSQSTEGVYRQAIDACVARNPRLLRSEP